MWCNGDNALLLQLQYCLCSYNEKIVASTENITSDVSWTDGFNRPSQFQKKSRGGSSVKPLLFMNIEGCLGTRVRFIGEAGKRDEDTFCTGYNGISFKTVCSSVVLNLSYSGRWKKSIYFFGYRCNELLTRQVKVFYFFIDLVRRLNYHEPDHDKSTHKIFSALNILFSSIINNYNLTEGSTTNLLRNISNACEVTRCKFSSDGSHRAEVVPNTEPDWPVSSNCVAHDVGRLHSSTSSRRHSQNDTFLPPNNRTPSTGAEPSSMDRSTSLGMGKSFPPRVGCYPRPSILHRGGFPRFYGLLLLCAMVAVGELSSTCNYITLCRSLSC